MNFQEFKTRFNGAPAPLKDFADFGITINDNSAFVEAAEDYLAARNTFSAILMEGGIEPNKRSK